MANIIEITDFSDPALDVFARMSEAQLLDRDKGVNAMFIGESPKVVERALDYGYEPVSLLLEPKHITGEAKEIVERVGDVPVFSAPFEVLKQITGFPLTRGVLCAMRRKPLPKVENVIQNANRIAVLENVMNPANVGAVFRSAAALGFDAVLLTSGSSDPFYRRAIRVSMGTVFQIPWTYLDGEEYAIPQKVIDLLHQNGFVTAAMALSDDSVGIDYPDLRNAEKLAVVLGTEGDGLAARTVAACDYTVKIPMANGVDSLNVAAASAVAFWELRRR